MVFSNNLLMGAAGQSGESYVIDQSIRFNDNDAAYMSRTSATPTSTTIFTISLWFKRSLLSSSYPTLINEYSGNSDAGYLIMRLQPDDTINVSGYATNWRTTTRVFRDPSAWYHFVLAVDTNQATAADRIKLYINGVEETSFTANSNPDSGTTLGFNTGGTQNIARINPAIGGTNYFDGYMSEFNFIDGQALAPTDLGEYNDSGVWVPKAYAGAYGDNGFYLTGATAADLGEDFSGNNNDFTSSGLTTADQMLDTPTNNYPTYNSISTLGTLSDGNLVLSIQDYACPITQSYPTSGIWQTDFELDVVSGTDGAGVGVLDYSLFQYRTNDGSYTDGSLTWGGSYGFGADGTLNSPSAYNVAYGSNWFTAGNIISIIYNADVGAVWFAVNGTLQNSAIGAEIESGTTANAAFTGLSSAVYTPFTWSHNSAISMILLNETQQSISGLTSAKLLSTANLTDSTITTSGSFTGNVNTNGPFVFLNGVPTAMTINGNAVTFGTDADKLANGFKVRSSSSSYNSSGTNTFVVSATDGSFADNVTAQINP
jgi:hypothetical protein